ncbi:3'-5' exonuclease [Candidatus Fermentibacteria bacterium]|nr:3'-5' exonuclease [Candidatus Fermentibacteria bacterium]
MKNQPDLFAANDDHHEPGVVRVLYIDTETTGSDPSSADVCEIGAVLAPYEGLKPAGGAREEFESLVKPSEPIPPEASAVHHITDSMVSEAPLLGQIERKLSDLAGKADLVCAHNAPFDLPILRRLLPSVFGRFGEDVVLDSLRLAKHVWPDIPSHALQVLRYRFDLGQGIAGDAHRALFDAHLVRRLVELVIASARTGCSNWRELLEYTRSPLEIQTFGFGKYRGSLVEDVIAQDADYVRWLLQQKWVPIEQPDLYYTLLRKTGPQAHGGK